MKNNDNLQILERQLQIATKEIEKRRGLSELEKAVLQIENTEKMVREEKDKNSIRMSFSLFGFLAGLATTLSLSGTLTGWGMGKLADDWATKLGIKSKMHIVDIIRQAPQMFINLVNYVNNND